MDFISPEFLSALVSIIIIDLVLGGDNAIVIAMATRKLDKAIRKKVIFWGVVGAIIIRVLMTIFAVYLLQIPLLKFVGGLLLIWIAFKLLYDKSEHDKEVEAKEGLLASVRTIIVADVIMGIDNVLAIAGAADGHIVLVVLGLIVSVPIIVFGSTIILKFIDRFPIIIYIGAGVIAWVAGGMIASDAFMYERVFYKLGDYDWVVALVTLVGVLAAGFFARKKAGLK